MMLSFQKWDWADLDRYTLWLNLKFDPMTHLFSATVSDTDGISGFHQGEDMKNAVYIAFVRQQIRQNQRRRTLFPSGL